MRRRTKPTPLAPQDARPIAMAYAGYRDNASDPHAFNRVFSWLTAGVYAPDELPRLKRTQGPPIIPPAETEAV